MASVARFRRQRQSGPKGAETSRRWPAARRRGRTGERWRFGARLGFRSLRAAALGALCWLAGAATGVVRADEVTVSAAKSAAPAPVASVSGNPAATTFSTGTGWLGRQLGLRDEWGITLGGIWLADTNLVAAGGAQPGGWTNNSALFVGLSIDADKLVGWRGASFGFQFLQLNAGNTNGEAGSVQGYNGIVGPPALQPHRTLRGLVRAGDDQGRPEDPHWPRQSRRRLQQRPAPSHLRRQQPEYSVGQRPDLLDGLRQRHADRLPARLLQLGKRRDRQLHPDQVLLSQPRGLRRKQRPPHTDRHGPALVQRLLLQHRRDRHQLDARRGQSSRAVRHRPLAPDRHPHRAGRHTGWRKRRLPVRLPAHCPWRERARSELGESPPSSSSAPATPKPLRSTSTTAPASPASA